jgi:hypothetical protein
VPPAFTKKSDPLGGEKELSVNKINYVFDDNNSEKNLKQVSQFLSIEAGIPYTNKSISSVLYEIYERAVSISTLEDFNDLTKILSKPGFVVNWNKGTEPIYSLKIKRSEEAKKYCKERGDVLSIQEELDQ